MREAQRLSDMIAPARSTALDKLGEDGRAIAIAVAWLRPKLIRALGPTGVKPTPSA